MNINFWKKKNVLQSQPTPPLSVPSFKKISDGKYRIFGIEYAANQILEISANGQRTLDGNTEYYFKPKFKIYSRNQLYVQDYFRFFATMGKSRNIDVDSAILIPTGYTNEWIYSKTAPEIMPVAYNFKKPNTRCNILCIPFDKNNVAMPFGVFGSDVESLSKFVSSAAFNILSCIIPSATKQHDVELFFGNTMCTAFEREGKSR